MLSIKDRNWYYNKMFYITDKQVFNDFKKLLENLKVINLNNQYVIKDFNSFKFIKEKPYYRISNSSSFGNGTFDGYKKYPTYASYEVIELKSVDYGNHKIDYNSWGEFKNINNIVLNNQPFHLNIPTIDLSTYKVEPISSLNIDSSTYDYLYNDIMSTVSACCVDNTKYEPSFITATDWNINNSNIKEEKENIMKLLEIYKDRKIERIYKVESEKKEEIRLKDADYAAYKKLNSDKVSFIGDFSDEIKKKLAEVDAETKLELEKTESMVWEIEAQLAICETYEQKVTILKLYNILDEEGKLSI